MFNLRGNCRTSGELRRKEGDNVFGLGSRTPISITILVKKPDATGSAEIRYRDIGDYLKANDKFKIIKDYGSILNPSMQLSSIVPNQDNDWLNQRDELFATFVPLVDSEHKKYATDSQAFFVVNSRGLETSRDPIVYNSSRQQLESNVITMIDGYNAQRKQYQLVATNTRVEDFVQDERASIIWTRGTRHDCARNIPYEYSIANIHSAIYRPYFKQNAYVSSQCNEYTNHWPCFFPTPQTENLVICVSGIAGKTFSTLMTNCIPDLHILESGTQCFPLYWYEKHEQQQLDLFDKSKGEYIRHDGISDFALKHARELYGSKTTKEDIFYYIYGLLHSPDYRQRFEADLTKMLPRIPFVEATATFKQFSSIGRQLSELHINYELVEAWSELIVSGDGQHLTVEKMHFGKDGKTDDKRIIWLNSDLKVENIPLHAYDYIVNGKSAIEWLMERYAVTKDKDSGIVNDANAWGQEHNNPKYILELLCRIVTVSMKTLELVGKLPHLEFD